PRAATSPSEGQSPEPEKRASDASPSEKINRVAERGTYPATDAQERLWFSYRVARDNPVYNQGLQVRILGGLKVDALRESIAHVLSRHEAVHTRFKSDSNGRLLQWVEPASEIAIQLCDLSEGTEPEASLFAWIRHEERLPFDLENGPVARCAILRMGPSSHVLAFTFHHILIDGWSLGVLITEIMKAYVEFAAGRSPMPPAIPLHMGDYACWERELVAEGRHRSELDGHQASSPALELPTCVDSGSEDDEEGSILYFELTRNLEGRLRALAAQSRVTLSTLLNAAFACLLARYTGQKRFGLGLVMANRSRPEQEGIVGFLANTMLVDCNLEGNSGLQGLLASIHAEVERALTRSWLPMSTLLSNSAGSSTEVGQSALLAAVFSYQGIFRNTSWALEDTTWELFNRNNVNGHVPGTSKFDLWLSMYPWRDDTLGGSLEFRTARIGRAYAERFIQHFKAVLDSMTREPRDILNMDLLVREDYEALQRWNATEADYPKHRLVHELFEAQALERPTAIAVATETQQASYAQLNERANALAQHLRSLGVQPGVNVAICVERSVDMVAGLLAILKVGGVYVPLDPAFPPLRVSFMLEDSRARVVVSQSNIDGSAWPTGITRVDLDTLPERVARVAAGQARQQSTGDELMYIIYTSGSTGQPKGVRVKHRSVINLLNALAKELRYEPEDTLLAVTTLSFDIAALELFMPLVTGGRVELASASEARDVHRLQRRIEQRRVTVMQATPSTWQMFRAADMPRNATLRVLCGGEALPNDLATWLVAHFHAAWNVYGPTETTIWSTACRLGASSGPSVHIGLPLANTQVHVLDEGGRRVPIGVPGELNISGDGVAAGYFERPELTAEKFVARSWLGQSCPMYRTGDLVRQRLDGELEFLGRLDHQVKIHGFRIELGEVEAALLRHPSLEQCVCVVRTDSGDSHLVAYLVAATGGKQLPDGELLRHLGSTLPGYMLPAAFVWLDRFPLTPNGKVDRRSLPAPSSGLQSSTAEHIPPSTETERALVRICEEILGSGALGINEDFFRRGGDSLKSVRLQARAAKVGLVFSIRDVFEARTIGALARRIDERRISPHALPSVSLDGEQVRAALWSDVRLAESVRVRPGSRAVGNAVLLTGATGFLGTHLLRELAAHRQDPIYVLVREPSAAKARVRLAQSLEQYGLPLESLERVKCLAGDLKLPGLGLSRDVWTSLSGSLEHIYHSAAAVNHVEGYAALKSANVDGLEQLLALAAEGGSAVHLVSTLDVLEPSEYPAGTLVREDAEVPPPIRANGYAQSKWVAEKVMALASQRGI
ncbi:MAG TPA: amino acid adenylation domain-containing protein, partial [Polyangiaceae bacterium]|nr:amino acid adenylation domain-containing protein [Polyangiaceae bacterium]